MFIPRWITFLIAACVIGFGVYRIYIAFTTDPETLAQRKGLYGLPRRTHILFGILYLLLGAFLIASAFGFRLFRFG